jgi:hypothetical protein
LIKPACCTSKAKVISDAANILLHGVLRNPWQAILGIEFPSSSIQETVW